MTDREWAVTALLCVASSGGAWRMLPRCFPPVPTVRRYFYAWRNAGLFETINTALVMNLREIEGREASPSVGVIDSQSVKTTENSRVSGHDAGRKIRAMPASQPSRPRAAMISEAVAKAVALHKWLLSPAWGKPWVAIREIVRLGPNRLRESPEAKRAVQMLVEHGMAGGHAAQ